MGDIRVNADELVAFTNRLENLHKSALPNAVRGTLNRLAFDVKQKTMPDSVASTFTIRRPNFFKANSRVMMADGWNIMSMRSEVGFTTANLTGVNNYAVSDLEQQERGGKIDGKSFIPMAPARGGGMSKPVRPGNRLSSLKKIVNASHIAGNRKQAFVKAVKKAGPGGYVLGNGESKVLWRINSISLRGGNVRVKKTALYSYRKNRSVTVKATSFMQTASTQSVKKVTYIYIAEAKRQLARLQRK